MSALALASKVKCRLSSQLEFHSTYFITFVPSQIESLQENIEECERVSGCVRHGVLFSCRFVRCLLVQTTLPLPS